MNGLPMTPVTVPGIPESIPLSRCLDAIKSLGIDPQATSELRFTPGAVYVSIPATGEHGNGFSDGEKPSRHVIAIQLVDDIP